MLLSNIVKLVNAKSFGETTYTYDDIYPYFQEALNSLNGQLDTHRRIPDAPVVYDEALYDTMSYDWLQDMHISNYIVTYIVVAMDNASLAVTDRTETYASQLNTFRQQLIADLYKWMPLLNSEASAAFDLTGQSRGYHLKEPNVRIWYDERIGGKLSAHGDVAPTRGVRWDNPYGTVVLHPDAVDYKLKLGPNSIPYIFIPDPYFRKYYSKLIITVTVYGHNIEYNPSIYETTLIDVKTRDGLDELLLAAWTRLKDINGNPLYNSPSVIAGTYKDSDELVSVLVMQHKEGVYFLDAKNKKFYYAEPVDLNADPVVFNKDSIFQSTIVTKDGALLDSLEVTDITADITADIDDLKEDLKGFVTLDGRQTITGQKTFESIITTLQVRARQGIVGSDGMFGLSFDASGAPYIRADGLILQMHNAVGGGVIQKYYFPDKDGYVVLEEDLNTKLSNYVKQEDISNSISVSESDLDNIINEVYGGN